MEEPSPARGEPSRAAAAQPRGSGGGDRALLPEYQQALDDLFVRAENQVAAITMAEYLPRSEALHLAMLVSLARDLMQMQQKINELEQVR